MARFVPSFDSSVVPRFLVVAFLRSPLLNKFTDQWTPCEPPFSEYTLFSEPGAKK